MSPSPSLTPAPLPIEPPSGGSAPVSLFHRDFHLDLDDAAYHAILDRIEDGVYMVDNDRRIVLWNDGAERITGYPRQEVLGLACGFHGLCHVDAAGNPLCVGGCPLHDSATEGTTSNRDAFLQHKMGHRIPVHIYSMPLYDRHHRLVGAVEIFRSSVEARRQDQLIVELSHLAMIDDLTRLPNRRHFDMQLDRRLAELNRFGWPFGTLMIDLDHFKEVNDRYGHHQGDEVLQIVARTLSANSRSLDTIARWGGEEFAAIITNVREDELLKVAEKLRAMVEVSSARAPGGDVLRVTVSIGAALAQPNETAPELMKRTDEMLYAAKKAGRNRVAT